MAVRRINGRSVEVVGVINGGTPTISTVSGLSVPAHDYVELTYAGSDLTGVIYKSGGSWNTVGDVYTGGQVVGQLELTYTGGNLAQIVRVI